MPRLPIRIGQFRGISWSDHKKNIGEFYWKIDRSVYQCFAYIQINFGRIFPCGHMVFHHVTAMHLYLSPALFKIWHMLSDTGNEFKHLMICFNQNRFHLKCLIMSIVIYFDNSQCNRSVHGSARNFIICILSMYCRKF